MGKNKQQRPWAEVWREASAYGCIIPDYTPDCPHCDNANHVGWQPRKDTGIFRCSKCGGNIVVLWCQGDEASILIEELVEEGTATDADGKTVVVAGLGVYSPMELVEDTDAR